MSFERIRSYDAERARRNPYSQTLRELAAGLSHSELWRTLGWMDIRQRYSRSVIGPFWVTLSIAAFVGGLAITYGALFNMPLTEYLPFLAVGIVLWMFISAFMIEGCQIFIQADAAIKQMPAPITIHLFRFLHRNLIILMHNSSIVVLTLLVLGKIPGWNGLLAIPGMAVVIINCFFLAMIVGTLSARFRDIPPLVGNLVQMTFFITPILWRAEDLPTRRFIVDYNPFYYLIEVVRGPLLNRPVPEHTFNFLLVFTAINVIVGLFIFARLRQRIPYWL